MSERASNAMALFIQAVQEVETNGLKVPHESNAKFEDVTCKLSVDKDGDGKYFGELTGTGIKFSFSDAEYISKEENKK